MNSYRFDNYWKATTTGLYKVSETDKIQISLVDSKLILQINNEEKIYILAEKENVFFTKGEDIEVVFVKSNNIITEIKLKQGLSIKTGDKIQ